MKTCFTCDLLLRFKDCHFDQFGTISAQFFLALLMRKCRDFIRLRNRFKLLEGSLFAVIDLLLDAKFITLYFISRVGDDFPKKNQ